MQIAPVRNLSEFGILPDLDPYNLPPNAFSAGVNVRFVDGAVERGPVFRDLDALTGTSPRMVQNFLQTTGLDLILIGYLNGSLATWAAGTETDVSIAAYSGSDSESPFTAATLGSVIYVNREDRVPWYKRTSMSDFAVLTNWDSGWRAKLLRTCGGALVALGVTKSGTAYPTMVKTSEFATFDAAPADWNEADPTSNATENVLQEMDGPITDGRELGNNLIIYGANETWLMQPDGSSDVFRYRRVFRDAGAINANCAVEVANRHYVFGPNDIWMHDGTSKASICDNRARKFIFRNMDISQSTKFFVVHNPVLKEIMFCYVSGDPYVGFINGTGCNRAAVWSYSQSQTGVWTFYDLPYVTAATVSSVELTSVTYDTVTETYEEIGGSYLDEEDASKKVLIMVGNAYAGESIDDALYALDLPGPGSIISTMVNTAATKPVQLERGGLDLDDLGVALRGYKLMSSVYPQARLEDANEPLEFAVGANDYFNVDPEFSAYQTYDGDSLYKLDYNVAGRYLHLKLRHAATSWFRISGIDYELDVLGDR